LSGDGWWDGRGINPGDQLIISGNPARHDQPLLRLELRGFLSGEDRNGLVALAVMRGRGAAVLGVGDGVLFGVTGDLVGGAVREVPVVEQVLGGLDQLAPSRQHAQDEQEAEQPLEDGAPT